MLIAAFIVLCSLYAHSRLSGADFSMSEFESEGKEGVGFTPHNKTFSCIKRHTAHGTTLNAAANTLKPG